jgi:hypothetical protein
MTQIGADEEVKGIANCKLQIANWAAALPSTIDNLQFAVRNLQFAICNTPCP